MKNILFFVILLVTSYSNCYSQNWQWARAAGGGQYDVASCIATDKLGNTYMAGRTGGSSGLIFFNKYDTAGNVLWSKTFLGNGNDQASGVTIDFSGNIYVTGSFCSSMLTFDSIILNNQSYGDIFLVKYNPNGSVIWAKRAGGNNSSYGSGSSSVTTDLSGNVYVCGSFSCLTLTFDNITVNNLYSGTISGQTPNRNMFLVKYDTNGNVLWVKVAGGNYNNAHPADAASVTTDNLGNIYVTGGFACSSITFGNQVLSLQDNTNWSGDVFIVKYDNLGNVIWAKSAGGSFAAYGASVAADTSGNVYVAGSFECYALTFDTITLINPKGVFSCPGGCSVYPADFIVKYDINGNVTWAKSLGSNYWDQANSVITDVCGNIYMTGCISDSTAHSLNMFIANIDTNGNILFTKNAEGGNNLGTSLSLDISGNIYVAGNFRNDSILLTPYLLNYTGNKQMFIAKLQAPNIVSLAAPLASNKTICSGSSASLSANGIGTLGWYSEAAGGTYLGGGANFTTPILTASTTYYVQANTCFGSSPRTAMSVTVNPLPTITAYATSTLICAGTNVTLLATGASTYTWSGGVLNGISFAPQSTITYTVTGTDGNNCSGTDAITINVKPSPIITPYATETAICVGTAVTLIATGATSYTWSGGVTSGIGFVPSSTTTYTVTGTGANNCSNTASITINVNPRPDVTTNLNGVTISANQNGTAYQWLDCNNGYTTIAGAINQSYTATINGDYEVIVIMNGCPDTSACVNITTTGINEIVNNNHLTVYPNPSNGAFTIQSTREGNYSIMNELDQTIQLIKLNATNTFTSNIENLSTGIYFIVGFNSNQMTRQRIVVTK